MREASAKVATSFWRELREGLTFIRRHRGLMVNTIMIVASMAGIGASYPLTFFLAIKVLDGGTKAFGVFEAVLAVGYLAGSVALATVATRVRKGYAMTIGLIAMGLCLAIVALAGGVWQACIPFAVLGIANSFALIAVDTYLQEAVPQELSGRVFGVRFTLAQGTYAVSVLVGGALAGVFDVRALFVVAGVSHSVACGRGLFVRDIRERSRHSGLQPGLRRLPAGRAEGGRLASPCALSGGDSLSGAAEGRALPRGSRTRKDPWTRRPTQ